MTPIEYLQKLLEINKSGARFIMTGLGLIAAAAVAVAWIGGQANVLTLAIWILGFAAAIAIVSFVVSNPLMKKTLGWMLIGSFGFSLAIAVDSVMQFSGRTPYPVCLRAMLEVPPRTCMKRFDDGSTGEVVVAAAAPEAPPLPVPTATASGGSALPGTAVEAPAEEPVIVMEEPAIVMEDPGLDPPAVYVHYSRDMTADEAANLSSVLQGYGYDLPGGPDGAQKVGSAPSRNVVRYYSADYAEIAKTLALDVSQVLGDAPVTVQDFSKSGLVAPDKLMEVWVTR